MSWSDVSQTLPTSSTLSVAAAYTQPPSAPLLTSPANTSLEENAAMAQSLLVEYQQQVHSYHPLLHDSMVMYRWLLLQDVKI